MGANLSEANLMEARSPLGEFTGCSSGGEQNLTEASLRWAGLFGANLQEANLSNAHLECANLEDADLRRAVMRGVFLNQANIRGALLPLSFKERLSQYLRDRSHRFEQLN